MSLPSKSSTTTEADGPTLRLPPIHPGETLTEELAELGLSGNALARALDVPPNRVTEIVAGKRAVTADTALRLARYLSRRADDYL